MKKSFILAVLTAILLVLNACASNPSPTQQLTQAEQDQLATIVAATISTMNAPAPVAEISPTQTPPNLSDLSINGQLQGLLTFIRNDNLWVSINGVESQITTDAIPTELPYITGVPALWYSNPQISPDKAKIAYLKNSGTDVRTLMIYDIDGKNSTQLANDAAWVPPAMEWSNDGQKIYYLVSNGYDVTTGVETMVVKSINLTTGELQEHGQYGVITGCGGGSSDPADGISSDENIRGSSGGGYVFKLSPQNNYLIHATVCHDVGLAILDLSTHQDRTLDKNVRGAVISPDGSRIAAISDKNIVVFNVITGSIESNFPALEQPRALMWDVDGKEILYSTSRLVNEVKLDDNLDLVGWASRSFKLNVSTLWVISLESGQSTKIIEMEAHDLKPIFTNGQKVLVVMVENSNKLFDYITQGNRENLAEYYPSVYIAEVDLIDLSSIGLTSKTQQASFLNR